jgi:hypothetical protein
VIISIKERPADVNDDDDDDMMLLVVDGFG